MEYMPQVRISKEDFLALSDLAGEMSIMDYMSNIIHEHVAAQQSAQADEENAIHAMDMDDIRNPRYKNPA